MSGEDGWPMITGGGCEAEAVTAVIQGKIEDDLLFDNRVLANDCVTMVDAILKGEKPEIPIMSSMIMGPRSWELLPVISS